MREIDLRRETYGSWLKENKEKSENGDELRRSCCSEKCKMFLVLVLFCGVCSVYLVI
jgi:hypothetical protein